MEEPVRGGGGVTPAALAVEFEHFGERASQWMCYEGIRRIRSGRSGSVLYTPTQFSREPPLHPVTSNTPDQKPFISSVYNHFSVYTHPEVV